MLSGHSISMRLTKGSNAPALAISVSCDVSSGSAKGSVALISLSLLVDPLRKSQIVDLREPRVSPQDVYIFLPTLPMLRQAVERFKAVSTVMRLSANNAGELVLSAESPSGKMETTFSHLDNAMPTGTAVLVPRLYYKWLKIKKIKTNNT